MLAPGAQHATTVSPRLNYVPGNFETLTKLLPATQPIHIPVPLDSYVGTNGRTGATGAEFYCQDQTEDLIRLIELNKRMTTLPTMYFSKCTSPSLPYKQPTVHPSLIKQNGEPIISYTHWNPLTLSAAPHIQQLTQIQVPFHHLFGEGTVSTHQYQPIRIGLQFEDTGSMTQPDDSKRMVQTATQTSRLHLTGLLGELESSPQAIHQETHRRISASRKSKPNIQRRRKRASATSRFRGVSWHRRDRRWIARAWINGKITSVGSFKAELEAAKAVETRYIKEYGLEGATDISKVLTKRSGLCDSFSQPKTLGAALTVLETIQLHSNPVPTQEEERST